MIHSISNNATTAITISISNKACCDNFVGIIKYNGNDFVSINNNQTSFGLQTIKNNSAPQQRKEVDYVKFQSNSNNRKIVVLIESPHIDEFTNLGNVNSGPALGKSGDNFDKNVFNVFNGINNKNNLISFLNLNSQQETFDVYFVNAIQYQCSLGISPINEGLRNFIFYSLWNQHYNSYKDDLIDRLNILNPDLIINAPTKEIKKNCCNQNSFSSFLKNNPKFLTASNHILYWNKNTTLV